MKKLLTIAALLSFVAGSQIFAEYVPNTHHFSSTKYFLQNTSGNNNSNDWQITKDAGRTWVESVAGSDPKKYDRLNIQLNRQLNRIKKRYGYNWKDIPDLPTK